MLRRASLAWRTNASQSCATGVAQCRRWDLRRHLNEPGWQRRLSTKDSRSREQREAERKVRQLEKLPKPEALHDFEYPVDKTLLCDQWFQPPVYENELDTPSLFHMPSPPDFFVYWSVHDFERTAYPPLPKSDHRAINPAIQSAEWQHHVAIARQYLTKHEIVPQFCERPSMKINPSFVFGAEATPLAPSTFWKSAHFGNFIELKDVQSAPVVAFPSSGQGSDDTYYTMIMASPDYPFRSAPGQGFFLHSVVSNIRSHGSDSGGCTVVDYVPPLPTEDAGAARCILMLFEQPNGKINSVEGRTSKITFAERSNYRMHALEGTAAAHGCNVLRQVEAALGTAPAAINFFTTTWDIQVQEFYESHGLPEPQYWPSDVEDVLRYNALPLNYHRASSRVLPDGSINKGTVVHQHAKTNTWMATVRSGLSSKALRDAAGKPLAFPRP